MRDPRKRRDSHARHYYLNAERNASTKARAVASLRAKREHVNALKEASPCSDCGVSYPHYVMDYDHVPARGTKKASVGQLLSAGYRLEVVLEEIGKCDLVCSNCHRLRTFGGGRP